MSERLIAAAARKALMQDPTQSQAVRESYRVLRADGVLLCSFLDLKGRWFNPLLGAFLVPIKMAKGEIGPSSSRYLPWLKVGGEINLTNLYRRQPYAYWTDLLDTTALLTSARFVVAEAFSRQSGLCAAARRSAGE